MASSAPAGGLCLAQGLARAGIAATVFERDRTADSRWQGYRLRIDGDGQQALRQVMTPRQYELFRQSCSLGGDDCFIDPQLRALPERKPAHWRPSAQADDAAERDLSANRQTLREILASGLEGQIRWGHALRGFRETPEGLLLDFEARPECEVDVLIAADGVGSAVRRQLIPGGEPDDGGAIVLYGVTPWEALPAEALTPELGQGVCVVFGDGLTAVIEAMRFRAPLPELARRLAPEAALSPLSDYWYWACVARAEDLGGALPAERLSGDALRARCAAGDARLAFAFAGGFRAWRPAVPGRAGDPHQRRGAGLALRTRGLAGRCDPRDEPGRRRAPIPRCAKARHWPGPWRGRERRPRRPPLCGRGSRRCGGAPLSP